MRYFTSSTLFCLLLTLVPSSVCAFDLGDRSLGIGVNRNGFLLEGAFFDQAQWHHGFYVGFGGWAKSEEGEPLDGYFPWVDYAETEWAAAYSLHGGYAFRPNREVGFGLGLGLSFRDNYRHGTSPVTGLEWKVDAPDDSEVGPHGWVEIGEPRGKALRVQYGPARLGATFQWRY